MFQISFVYTHSSALYFSISCRFKTCYGGIFFSPRHLENHCYFGEFKTKPKDVLELKSQIQSIVEYYDNLKVTVT